VDRGDATRRAPAEARIARLATRAGATGARNVVHAPRSRRRLTETMRAVSTSQLVEENADT
jgi:hypothetical protein